MRTVVGKNSVFQSFFKFVSFGSLALAATLAFTPAARADAFYFSANGSGITTSGTITATQTSTPGTYKVTSINGTFTDATNGFSGAITGLNSAPDPTFNPPPFDQTFSAPAFAGGFSYDNRFYVNGDSPAVCIDALAFFGGVFDVYGLSFNVAGGYVVDIWSNGQLGGYQVGDSLNGVKLSPEGEGAGFGVDVSTSPVPEPGSLILLGTGLPGLIAVVRRKRAA